MRNNKIFFSLALVLTVMFIYQHVDAAKRFDSDVGWNQSIVKTTPGGLDYQQYTSPAAFEQPVMIRHEYVKDSYQAPKSKCNLKIWNARINHNYPFQIPGKAGPPSIYYPLLE